MPIKKYSFYDLDKVLIDCYIAFKKTTRIDLIC